MKNSRWMVGVGFALCLSACGAADGTVEEMNPEGEPIEEVQQAVDVAGLTVGGNGVALLSGQIYFECVTWWTLDAVHTLESGCRLQKFTGGAWVPVSPWYTQRGGKPYSNVFSTARVRCVNGLYRAEGRGRILFSGGWSPLEYDLSSGTNIRCPNPQ